MEYTDEEMNIVEKQIGKPDDSLFTFYSGDELFSMAMLIGETLEESEDVEIPKNIGNSRKIKVVDLEGYVYIYPTILDAAKELNMDHRMVKKGLTSKDGALGYTFSYLDILKPEDGSQIKNIVTRDGRVLPDYVVSSCGLIMLKSGKWSVGQTYNGGKRIELNGAKEYVHLIVARTFLGVENKQVVHKDKNKSNNRLSNIHYLERKQTRAQRMAPYGRKRIVCKDINGNVIEIYSSMTEASSVLKCNISSVSKCCNGRIKTCKGRMLCFEN